MRRLLDLVLKNVSIFRNENVLWPVNGYMFSGFNCDNAAQLQHCKLSTVQDGKLMVFSPFVRKPTCIISFSLFLMNQKIHSISNFDHITTQV